MLLLLGEKVSALDCIFIFLHPLFNFLRRMDAPTWVVENLMLTTALFTHRWDISDFPVRFHCIRIWNYMQLNRNYMQPKEKQMRNRWFRNTRSQESWLAIKAPPAPLLFFIVFSSSKSPSVHLFSFWSARALKNHQANSVWPHLHTSSSVSAVDHPLLISFPLGSAGDSLLLSVPWLQ